MQETATIRVTGLRLERSVGGPSFDEQIERRLSQEGEPLRWAVVRAHPISSGTRVDVEATILKEKTSCRAPLSTSLDGEVPFPDAPVFLHVVPTGYQATVGGSLGDAMPANTAFSRLGFLISNPNSFNGGIMNTIDGETAFYVEGSAMDEFAKGKLVLARESRGPIGVAIDCGLGDEWVSDRAYNAVGGFFAHTGAFLAGIETTDEPVGGVARQSKWSGAFFGEVRNVSTLFRAVEKLEARGAKRIAVFTFIAVGRNHWKQYFRDKSPNPVGGTEAIISHSVVRRFGIMAAHAPLLRRREERLLQSYGRVRPAAGLEAADPFYVPSVLLGLRCAPRLLAASAANNSDFVLPFKKVSALICPASTMGGIPMMRAEAAGIPIIGVRQSETVLDVRAAHLGYESAIEVEDYLEAIGLLLLSREGGDFSVKNLRNLLRESSGSLRAIGEGFCLEQEINPAALLRPLYLPE